MSPRNLNKLEGLEPVSRRGTAEIIAERIRSAIIDGPFAAGDQLSEGRLAEALGVSRGPVREALQRLIQEGLVRDEPSRGVFVVHLDPEDIEDIYYARTAIECAAALRLLESKNDDDLEELQRCVGEMRDAAQKGNPSKLAYWDLEFHKTLTQAANSKRLTRMFETLLTETRMALAADRGEPGVDTSVINEHAALLEALRAGDRSRTLSVVRRHMESGVRRRLSDVGHVSV
jgi:DNA-binding GntR family transcriptional regulator